jgi:hypothetical protein
MVNPFSIIAAGVMNSIRRNNAVSAPASPALTEYINYFLSYPALILGTGTVMLTTLGISYYFNLKPYTYLISFSEIFDSSASKASRSSASSSGAPESDKYEFKYFDEYDKWTEQKQNETTDSKDVYQIENKEHIQECLNNMYYSTIKDYINDTYKEIIMCYDHATQSFAYYAKTANIPYKYLETAARKYVIETNAPENLYVDIRKEYENAKNKAQKTSNEKVTDAAAADATKSPVVGGRTPQRNPHTDDDAVFATFKKYNKTSNIPVSDIHSVKTSSSSQLENAVLSSVQGLSNQPNTDTNTPPILREKANRYSYRGKIEDFETHHASYLANRRQQQSNDTDAAPTDTTTGAETKTKMSYQEYKEMQKKLK